MMRDRRPGCCYLGRRRQSMPIVLFLQPASIKERGILASCQVARLPGPMTAVVFCGSCRSITACRSDRRGEFPQSKRAQIPALFR